MSGANGPDLLNFIHSLFPSLVLDKEPGQG
jgi:hypothetical protein